MLTDPDLYMVFSAVEIGWTIRPWSLWNRTRLQQWQYLNWWCSDLDGSKILAALVLVQTIGTGN